MRVCLQCASALTTDRELRCYGMLEVNLQSCIVLRSSARHIESMSPRGDVPIQNTKQRVPLPPISAPQARSTATSREEAHSLLHARLWDHYTGVMRRRCGFECARSSRTRLSNWMPPLCMSNPRNLYDACVSGWNDVVTMFVEQAQPMGWCTGNGIGDPGGLSFLEILHVI